MVRKFAAEAGRDVKAFPIVPSRWTGSPRRSLRSGREPGEEARAGDRGQMKDVAAGGSAPRIILVVARDRHDLYEYFQQGLAVIEDIKVMLDRRIMPRDIPSGGAPGLDRRERQAMADELQQRGFVMIHLW